MFRPDYKGIADPDIVVDPDLSDGDVLVSQSNIVGIAEHEIDGVANPNLMLIPSH